MQSNNWMDGWMENMFGSIPERDRRRLEARLFPPLTTTAEQRKTPDRSQLKSLSDELADIRWEIEENRVDTALERLTRVEHALEDLLSSM